MIDGICPNFGFFLGWIFKVLHVVDVKRVEKQKKDGKET